jgi:hypothetical protein
LHIPSQQHSQDQPESIERTHERKQAHSKRHEAVLNIPLLHGNQSNRCKIGTTGGTNPENEGWKRIGRNRPGSPFRYQSRACIDEERVDCTKADIPRLMKANLHVRYIDLVPRAVAYEALSVRFLYQNTQGNSGASNPENSTVQIQHEVELG